MTEDIDETDRFNRKTADDLRDHEVRDKARVLRFVGKQLGHASSHRPGKRRWMEYTLYRTDGGTYVLSGVGKTEVADEVDRYWVKTAETPSGVVEALHMRDDGTGERFLSGTALDLLEEVMQRDPAFREIEPEVEYID